MTISEVAPSYFGPVDPSRSNDPILILMGEFEADQRPEKMNAGVGVINDEQGKLWVPKAVTRASEAVGVLSGGYVLPMGNLEWSGMHAFLEGTIQLVFQDLAQKLLQDQRVAAMATIGGTHAVATFAEAVKLTKLGLPRVPRIIMGSPPYPNHPAIIERRGLKISFFNQVTPEGTYDMEANLRAMQRAPKHSVILYHGPGHNPTGIGPTSIEEWRLLAAQASARNHQAFFDVAYMGLDEGINADTYPIRIFMEEGVPVTIAVSFSKNAAMYSQRTGALLTVTPNPESTLDITRLYNAIMRTDVSSPTAIGQTIMSKIFLDSDLRKIWNTDLDTVSNILRNRRRLLADAMPAYLQGSIRNGTGLFTMLPLSEQAVLWLKNIHAIYVVSSGRVNIGGIPTDQMPRFAQTVALALDQYPIKSEQP